MGHKIVEAVIENGQIMHVNTKLPSGRMKVHLIYDAGEETLPDSELVKIVKETAGIYKDIDSDAEAKKIRASWERNVHN